jgi:hypothetical protein
MVTVLARSNGIPAIFWFAFVVIAIIVGMIQSREVRARMERTLATLAGQLQGRFTPAGLFHNATIRFALNDRPAVLEIATGKRPFSHLWVVLPRDPGGRVTISRNNVAEFFISAMEGRRLRIGDPIFDDLYAVRSRPESLGQRIFAPPRRQEAMTAVRRLIACSGLSIEVKPNVLEIRITEAADTPEIGMALVRTARDFLKFLCNLDVQPALRTGEFTELLSGHCPICTTTLAEPLVRCPRCRSPHHRQCWDYLGHCATYGCDTPTGNRRAA